MKDLISRLKDKPEHHRRKVTFAVSAGITTLVFVIWASVIFPANINTTIVQAEKVTKPKGDSPLKTLGTGAAQVYDAVSDLFGNTANVNLGAEYENMKAQVESGEVRFIPGAPTE